MSILGVATNAAKAAHPVTEEAKWKKPKTRQVNINVDSTFYADTFSAAVGAVARDYQGQFIAVESKFLPHVQIFTACGVCINDGSADNKGRFQPGYKTWVQLNCS
jgi:hypothetical protein